MVNFHQLHQTGFFAVTFHHEAFVELSDLYDKHIHDQSERRFVVECDGEKAGLVELVEINHVHRRAEFQIIISPEYQGKGLATRAAKLAMDYGSAVQLKMPDTALMAGWR
ncbi:GNAT family N-acetyltransferase, partial [Escherichia sp. R-CC3]